MADRLQQELAALPGLEQLSAAQLRDLSWRTKELIFLALFQEQVSSAPMVAELQAKSRHRKQERKTDRLLNNMDRDAIRKKEESFRADFMQSAATELARLGAPSLISWQKLVFDKDCCTQAFRLLLTRIKSSRRSGIGSSSVHINSSSLLAARYAANGGGRKREPIRRSSNNSQDAENCYDDSIADCNNEVALNESEKRTRFPPLGPTRGSARRVYAPKNKVPVVKSPSSDAGLDWNFDTSVGSPLDEYGSDESEEQRSSTPMSRTKNVVTRRTASRRPGDAGIAIERSMPGKAPSFFASKLNKDQVQSLKHDKTVLEDENAKLREEVAQLEALNAALQNDNASNNVLHGDPSEAMDLDSRRMRLLQAQNLQLQRQLSLLQDAMLARESAETELMSALQHWRDVIDAGRQEAQAAGADQHATDTPEEGETKKPIKWMLAVPDKLLSELKRVEQLIQGATTATNRCYEAKLRVSALSRSFLRYPGRCLKVNDVHSGDFSSLEHLNLDRVKRLEDSLADVARGLNRLSACALLSSSPSVNESPTAKSMTSDVYQLARSVRELTLEVGAFGVVVGTPTAIVSTTQCANHVTIRGGRIIAMDVMKALSPSSAVARGFKEREKQAKVMLKKLHANHTAMETDVKASQREAAYWRTAWQTQDDILCRLAKQVRRLGQQKLEWCRDNLMKPMDDMAEVFAAFQRAYDENTTRQNPYLLLLVEALRTEHPALREGLQQWRTYSSGVQTQLDELFDDYEANRHVLMASLSGTAATRQASSAPNPLHAQSDDILPSVSEQVALQ